MGVENEWRRTLGEQNAQIERMCCEIAQWKALAPHILAGLGMARCPGCVRRTRERVAELAGIPIEQKESPRGTGESCPTV